MAAMEPMALFGLEVPAGDVAITARGDIPAAFRITMAAIDPSAEPEGEDGAVPRATLKIIRHSLLDDDDDEEDFDLDEMERILGEEYDDDSEDDDEDDEDLVGGPSDPAKSKKARKAAALKEIMKLAEEDDMDEDDDEELANGVNGLKKSPKSLGKMPLDEDEDSEDDDEDDEYGAEVEEFVICTLDPTKNFQQPLDITIGEDERVLFKVSGTHSIFLTGNYVEPTGRAAYDDYDDEDDDEDEYDLEPDSDEELDYDEEEDELDDMEDPRIMELDEEEEVPVLVKADKKGKNKRAAQDDEDAAGLDALISKATKDEAANGEKLSKKQLKKQKKNDGSAAVTAEEKEAENGSAKSDKKVQFAKNLEQGPTPTKDAKDKSKGTLGVKKVQGVTIDDKKLGTGPAAKSGDRVSMRYIGKLEKNNKVFDSNKKGKPFTFKLGTGEVIKGWDIGIAGMTVGGERRITIPAHLAYGSKGAGADIPPNSTLVFDVKLLDVNRGK